MDAHTLMTSKKKRKEKLTNQNSTTAQYTSTVQGKESKMNKHMFTG